VRDDGGRSADGMDSVEIRGPSLDEGWSRRVFVYAEIAGRNGELFRALSVAPSIECCQMRSHL